MIRVAVCGFYNKGNIGDDRIILSLSRILDGCEVYAIPHDSLLSVKCMNEFDFIIVGGGNLIGESSSIFNGSYPMRKIAKPLGFGGLSVAGHIGERTRRCISDLASNAVFFWVRDMASKLAIGHADVAVRPDFTWTWPFEREAVEIEYEVACCFAPCPWKPNFIISDWMKEVERYSHICIPFYHRNNRDYELVSEITRFSVKNFSEVKFRKSRMILGSRLHSIIFAVQMEKPFIAINYDDKVKNFIKDNDLEEFLLDVHEHKRLPSVIEFIQENCDHVQEKIGKVRQNLVDRGREVAVELKATVSTAANSVS